MGNEKAVENNSGRKKILKKAAMLATIASITGACAVGGQKPKESEAVIGAIISAITAIVSVGAGIGQCVTDGIQVSNQKKMEAEEARRRAEEERRAAEQERIKAALETSEHNARVNQPEEESKGKVIDMSSADNSSILEKQKQEEEARARKRNNIRRPVAPPKGVNVGGFGASSDETDATEEVTENVETNTVKEEVTENATVNENNNVQTFQNTAEEKEETSTESNDINEIKSNIVKLSLKDLVNSDEDLSEKLNDISGEELVESLEDMESEGEYVDFDESELMSEKEAEKHRLVQEGLLTAEELTLLDFGIKNGAITENVLETMYENGDVSQEYYQGAMELLSELTNE